MNAVFRACCVGNEVKTASEMPKITLRKIAAFASDCKNASGMPGSFKKKGPVPIRHRPGITTKLNFIPTYPILSKGKGVGV